ncbi:MAG: type IV pilin, partial [Euryarchaeota archaeon]|nr:type IV pilin [Euryarchaeota archaeon]
MKNENKNDEAVSPVIATILMVAITVVLAGVLYVWASSLAEGNADGEFTTYVITADGNTAGDGPTTATDDSLVEMTMSTGQDINWAAVSVKISINDGAPLTCAKDSG